MGQFTEVDVPKRFGRYETLFRIAGGGMAEVFAARLIANGGFEKVVAVKRMLPSLADDPSFVTMFLDEARLAANIESPHVVQTLELGQSDDGSLFLVMELVVGLPLHRLVRASVEKTQPIPPEIVVDLISQAAMGLHDAHEASTPSGEPMLLVHRDVSPQNILVGRDGRVRIMDFGVAKALQRTTHTATGEVKGKLAYFSPEQACGERSLDRRSDIFSLGIVAWECFTGRRLFRGDSPVETVRNIIERAVPPVRELRPDVPDRVDEVLASALARDRAERYPTAAAFASALRAAVPPASRETTADYVRSVAHAHLQPFESALRDALKRPREDEPTQSEAVATESRGVTSAVLDTVEAQTPPPPPRRRLVGVVGGLLIAVATGLVTSALTGPRDGDVERPHASPLPEPRSAGVLVRPVVPTAVGSMESEDPAESEARSAPALRLDAGVEEPETGIEGRTTESRRGSRVSRNQGRVGAVPEPTSVEATMVTPTVPPPEQATMEAAPRAPTMEAAPRAPSLQGIDEFERHLR